jgi:hypothetical protein
MQRVEDNHQPEDQKQKGPKRNHRADSAFWQRAATLREETRGRISTDSADLIRQDRDER